MCEVLTMGRGGKAWGGPRPVIQPFLCFCLPSEWTPGSHSHFTVLEFGFCCGGEGLHGERAMVSGEEKEKDELSFS